jgi:dynein light intermediate chain 1
MLIHLFRSHILQDVQNSTKKSPPIKSIVVLGDNESGRSSLIARLKGTESVSKGLGIEYHYIDVKDENRDGEYRVVCASVCVLCLAH